MQIPVDALDGHRLAGQLGEPILDDPDVRPEPGYHRRGRGESPQRGLHREVHPRRAEFCASAAWTDATASPNR